MNELLAQLETSARQSDQDLAGLRIQKWKADAANKKQAEDNAAAIRRNLTNAIPALLQEVRTAARLCGRELQAVPRPERAL